jgi:tRNA (cytosine38-C5)-methyltransferase
VQARYIKGTGSILCEGLADDESPPASDGTSDRSLAALQPLAPRYLAPCEIARLHGFPATFAFPPTVSRKKQFELLGNSLSVDCVAALLRFMLADAAHNESHVGSAVSGGCAALADTDALEG